MKCAGCKDSYSWDSPDLKTVEVEVVETSVIITIDLCVYCTVGAFE